MLFLAEGYRTDRADRGENLCVEIKPQISYSENGSSADEHLLDLNFHFGIF